MCVCVLVCVCVCARARILSGWNGAFFLPVARGESFRASCARYSKMHVVSEVARLSARGRVA